MDLYDDRKFAECIYCGQKAMIVEDRAVEVDIQSRQVDPAFENLRYAIVNDKLDMIDSDSDTPERWFKKGFKKLRELSYDGENFKKCEASWRMAFSKLNSDYLLTDYSRLIGTCLGLLDEYVLDYDDNPGYTKRLLETINSYICERFGLYFTSDFYYSVLTGFAKTVDLDDLDDKFDLMLYLMSNSLRSESNPDILVTKCRQFEKTVQRYNDQSLDNDAKVTVGIIGYLVNHKLKSMSEGSRSACKSRWSEPTMANTFGTEWDIIEKNWHEIHDHFEYGDIDEFRREMIKGLEAGYPVGSNDEDVDQGVSYEHIEEEPQSLARKLTKTREFTQYFILNGKRYLRGIVVKTKEFDGDISNPSDLKRLQEIFEKEYKDYVPFGEDPDDYYEEFEGFLYGETFDDSQYQAAIIDFINGYIVN